METSNQIANRFREVILNGEWIANTNYQKQLSDVPWKQAVSEVKNLNTIAVLAFHINYYIEGVLNVFENGSLEIRDKYSFDLPPITVESQWKTLLDNMWINTEKLAGHIERMTEEEMESIFVDKKYGTYRRNIEGLIEHSYYHLGQISLIKKMINEI